ncbi:MAG: hypothetical protein Q3963_09255 [Coriobacteriaceae bacterium]|nr:hypothetical protein [Coriobacteriaceae bacterium]
MNKERFLDVNGFSSEYDIPLEKRLNKYRKGSGRDSSRTVITETEKQGKRSALWRAKVRRKQIVVGIAAAIVFAAVIALSVYLTFFL